jgi:hypothetical protein
MQLKALLILPVLLMSHQLFAQSNDNSRSDIVTERPTEVIPDIICPRMTLGAPIEGDQTKIVGTTVAFFIQDRKERPMKMTVEGLDGVYPHGTKLTMSFMDIFGRGRRSHGDVVFVLKGYKVLEEMIQKECGSKANLLVLDSVKNQKYCGTCSISPDFPTK